MKLYKKDYKLDEVIADIRKKQAKKSGKEYKPLKGKGTKLSRKLARKQLKTAIGRRILNGGKR